MGRKTVLMTGVSSFTGCYIANSFIKSGYEVIATLTKPREQYSEIQTRRLDVSGVATFIENAEVGSKVFDKIIETQSIDVFVHHGWAKIGYGESINVNDEYERITEPWPKLLKKLKSKNQNLSIIFTGTVYESGEGDRGKKTPPLTDYGVLKSRFWKFLESQCHELELTLVKVILPNAIGPLEDDKKLISSFWNDWENLWKP